MKKPTAPAAAPNDPSLPVPVGKNILLEPQALESKAIILPDQADKQTCYFKVLATGKKVTCCKRGDTVVVFPLSPRMLTIGGRQLGICDENAILAVQP